ncbi:DeoR/GlpR family DNA-binding transcription regulator [Desulfovibrio sp.]|uniref:DeoR/GlpR family DNA-binding transcription regulator n=1 Tax=Desulfovibrio sp. TaxID=885 RepID=UPI0025C5FC80|nr:DeoR/GlpR family DNA-binding transcription regulator [Desulfovibrio sp.]
MLPVERRRKMAHIIKSQGAVNTRELAEILGISIMTVRRDLKVLEEQNLLEITWGGAVPVGFEAHDIPRSHKASCMRQAKTDIARAACGFIEDDAFIALDAGTTTLELARLLPSLPISRLSVVTPDLEIALILSGHAHIEVFLTGGRVDPVSRACNDVDVMKYLRRIRTTMAFVGINVWEAEHGVTTSSSEKMHRKAQLMESADKSILLVDSSKYAKFSPWRVAGVEDFYRIITDGGLPAGARQQLEAAGASLLYAGS